MPLSRDKYQAEELMEALDLLEDSQGFKLYLQGLQDKLLQVERLLVTESVEFRLRQYQGKAQALREALELHKHLASVLQRESQTSGDVTDG